jgi:hypothetical protein
MLANAVSGFIDDDPTHPSTFVGKETPVDSIWMIEGHRYMKSFLEVVRGCPVSLVRHTWSPSLLQMFGDLRKHPKLHYTHVHTPGSKYNLVILEPNIGYVKSAVIPFTICEYIHKKHKDFINQVFVFNWPDQSKTTEHMRRNFEVSQKTRFFKSLLTDEILHFLNSQPVPFLVISHQLNNPWNYLYYEMWNYGIPLVHNSPDFKHLGYYYSDSDVEEGAQAVLNAAQYYEQLLPIQRPKIQKLLESMDPASTSCQTYWKDILEAEMFRATQALICAKRT